jgi:Icc-related predicted phosphoesterase
MNILAVSDVEVNIIYSPLVVKRFSDADLIIGCGDLPYYYLDYIASMLNRPLYYVNGNHTPRQGEQGESTVRDASWGGTNLHKRVVRDKSGLLLAGIEGSLRYNKGQSQYTQNEMWMMVFSMVPRLLVNRALFGRYLDVLVTHAPAWQIDDMNDLPHMGIKAFNWLVTVFQPALHLHGHIHIYKQYEKRETLVGKTRVINTCGYQYLQIPSPGK